MHRITPVVVAVAIVALSILTFLGWLSSLPSWQLTARNSPRGVVIEVYKSNADRPTYATVLDGQTIASDVERVTRVDLPPNVARTTFYDETVRPGRWTVMLNETEIDIMERALVLNGVTEFAPRD